MLRPPGQPLQVCLAYSMEASEESRVSGGKGSEGHGKNFGFYSEIGLHWREFIR